MSTAYTVCLILSGLFLSPLPKTDTDVLIGQINLYMTSDKEEIYWTAEYDRSVYPNDCAVLFDVYSFKPEICSEAELQYIRRIMEAYYGRITISPDTLLKRI